MSASGRMRDVSALAAVVVASLSLSGLARAERREGIAVSRLEPAARGGGMFVTDLLDLRGHLRPALGVTTDYAYQPLVVYDARGAVTKALVRHGLVVHAGASLVWRERLRLDLDLPTAVYQDGEPAIVAGEALGAATKPALGDVRVALDARVLGRPGEALTVAFGLRGWLPTGSESQLTSDGAVRIAPGVLASGALGGLVWGARAGVLVRPSAEPYAGSPVGSELQVSAGAGLRTAGGRLLVGPEVFAATGLASGALARSRSTPVDALIGAHLVVLRGVRASLGGGAGLGEGYGSPALRLVAGFEWAPPYEPSDRDRDGIPDEQDACPDVAGQRSSAPELHGCPPPAPVPREDTDGDGLWDTEDACPTLPGPRSSDPRTTGCPIGSEKRPMATVTDAEIRIEEQVRFEIDSAELAASSEAVLTAVARALDEHLEITKVLVEGHTDDTGDARHNDDLSARRAASVVAWLVAHGVDGQRLSAIGVGSRRPIDTNDTEAGRAKNRRVVFAVVERDAR